MSRHWPAIVYGPAYLDRVLHVDAPLLAPGAGGTIDRSMDGQLALEDDRPRIELHDESGPALVINTPPQWPGPLGIIQLSGRLLPSDGREGPRMLEGVSWHEDLGGMGAGYAAALGGTLVSALGDVDDPMSLSIEAHIRKQGIAHQPIRVRGRSADWTLLLSSGPHGDKLAIGFRGCHAAVESFVTDHDARLIVVAGLPIAHCERAFPPPADSEIVRLYAPSMRNITDQRDRARLIAADVLCCNRQEWETLPEDNRAAFEKWVPLIAVTDGSRGARIRGGSLRSNNITIEIPAFPRGRPPRDTNRAGEAFGSTLVRSLLDAGWRPDRMFPTDEFRRTAIRASAAAALELDMDRFGFPSAAAIDAALALGIVDGPPPRASATDMRVQ